MPRVEELVQKFKQCGRKMTPQRRAVLEALADEVRHPTAEQIYARVRKRMPDVSLATVYNTLRELTSMGELGELSFGGEERRYETSLKPHAHRICLNCGGIEDAPGDFDQIESLFEQRGDFRPVRIAVTIYGYCAKCLSENLPQADLNPPLD